MYLFCFEARKNIPWVNYGKQPATHTNADAYSLNIPNIINLADVANYDELFIVHVRLSKHCGTFHILIFPIKYIYDKELCKILPLIKQISTSKRQPY